MGNTKRTKELTERIRTFAFDLGFEKVGFASAQSPQEDVVHLEEWLRLGYNATMNWMSKRKDERSDIQQYFPGAKSVVSLAMNYYHGDSSGNMKISNYAWGDDYHNVLKVRLTKLKEFVQELCKDAKILTSVDTAPLMEKAWAQRAGLGWIGKHTNLISRDYGSWLFLGELILDYELTPDQPFEDDLCGSCSACIDACPTNAIVQDYLLDSNKCISYLTIEHRGDLPKKYETELNGWIYGCDICQNVCPWNEKFATKSKENSFAPRARIMEQSEESWSELNEDNFKQLFNRSSIKRTKFTGLSRNIAACK